MLVRLSGRISEGISRGICEESPRVIPGGIHERYSGGFFFFRNPADIPGVKWKEKSVKKSLEESQEEILDDFKEHFWKNPGRNSRTSTGGIFREPHQPFTKT